MEKKYVLKTIISGHCNDVRFVTNIPNTNDIISSSRDSTVVYWVEKDRNYVAHSIFTIKPFCYLNYLCWTYDFLGIENSFAVACQDKSIRILTINSTSIQQTINGHLNNVSCLSYNTKKSLLASGSWDYSIIIWDNDKIRLNTLKYHTASIWSLIWVNEKQILSCSADKMIFYWDFEISMPLQSFTGHSDCVRSLILLDSTSFVSSSNDYSIKFWNFQENCFYKSVEAHSNFIYQIDGYHSDYNFIGSVSEDGSCKLWKNDILMQKIDLPCQTPWSLKILPNKDLVIACSDHNLYVFTSNENFTPNEEYLAKFYQALNDKAKNSLSKDVNHSKNTNGIDVNSLPDLNDLQNGGTQEGQVKLIKMEDESVTAYSWSMKNQQWDIIGTVVESPSNNDHSTKILFEGRNYDQIINVQLDGRPNMKLPFNYSDDPYVVATNFLEKHNLPTNYLEEIIEFLNENMKNSSKNITTIQSDKFFPLRKKILFDASPIVKINEKVQTSLKAKNSSRLEDFNKLSEIIKEVIAKKSTLTSENLNVINKIWLELDSNNRYPLYDLIRILCLNEDACISILLLDDNYMISIMKLADILIESSTIPVKFGDITHTDRMLILRIFSNILAASDNCASILMEFIDLSKFSVIFYSEFLYSNDQLQISVSTLFLNVIIHLGSNISTEWLKFLTEYIAFFMRKYENLCNQSCLRILVGFGTFFHNCDSFKHSIKSSSILPDIKKVLFSLQNKDLFNSTVKDCSKCLNALLS
uniref:Phospholipase A-2-activating protein n=1 Tax=Tetracapsuloides bryosalmonae TaxID=271932 RepID=A0A859IQA4_9CNID|nr:phospholipase A-2-activating protein [Tetracapsuloides bryosalmonae]